MRFRPSLVSSLATLVVVLVTARLGVWQLSRYDTRETLRRDLEARIALAPLGAPDLVAPWERLADRRARVHGTWDDAPQVVSGGIPFGVNGYSLVQALGLDDGRTLFVNRGWIPVDAWEARLPNLVATGAADVTGLLVPIDGPTTLRPREGGAAPLWPLVEEPFLFGLLTRGVRVPWASLAAVRTGEVLGVALIAGERLADAEERDVRALPAAGFVAGFRTFHHLEYAAQWFGFGAIALGLWAWAGLRRGRVGG